MPQFFGQGKPPVGIVYDCDLGNTIDDALALSLLYGFQGKNEERVAAISVSKPNLKAAILADAISQFYLGEPGPFGGGNLAIGLATTGKMPDDTPMITDPIARVVDGKPAYRRSISKMNDTAEPVALIRNALSAQFDQNAIVVLSGPATNLVKLFDYPGFKELIAAKVKFLVAALGSYPSGDPEAGVQSDIPAAKRLLAEWPTPVIAVGAETGAALPFPGAAIEKDFAWSKAHPVVDAYRAFKPMPYDAPSTAMAAVLYAVRPKETWFKLSEPGTVTVQDDGRTRFQAAAGGRHQYVTVDPEQKERIIETYVQIASLKPAGRPQRFRPPQKKDAEEVKQ